MSDPASLIARIEALEIRIAYQDDTIDTLNKTITAQWSQIDSLKRAIDELRERLADTENRTGIGPASEPPPHY